VKRSVAPSVVYGVSRTPDNVRRATDSVQCATDNVRRATCTDNKAAFHAAVAHKAASNDFVLRSRMASVVYGSPLFSTTISRKAS
jgi:hypothetical protein